MKYKMPLVIVSFVLFSCTTTKIRKSELMNLKSTFSKAFVTKSFKTNKLVSEDSLLVLFDIYETNNDDKVKIEFDDKGDLQLNYKNGLNGNEFRSFKGKSKKKYYEIYLEKKRVGFTPLYSVTKINRLRVSITKDSTLVVQKYYNHSGVIFFLAGGSSNKRQYIFKNK